MNEMTLAAIFVAAAIVGLLASIVILRQRRAPRESPFAASTEGVKLCTQCGFTNNWIDRTCASCGGSLPG